MAKAKAKEKGADPADEPVIDPTSSSPHTTDSPEIAADVAVSEQPAPALEQLFDVDVAKPELCRVDLAVPLADPKPETYVAMEGGMFEIRLQVPELLVFRRLHAGLLASGATVNGRPVQNRSHVVEWLIQQIRNEE
jgi:hypothetical protein